MGATGTVTEVVGNKVYAFGHPFFNLGPSRSDDAGIHPRAAAEHDLVDEDLHARRVIGTGHQDRATTIAGLTGAAPRPFR